MMTANLFVIANVKQLRTDGSFRNLLPFFRTSWGVSFLNSTIFNICHNQVEFGTILEGLRYATDIQCRTFNTSFYNFEVKLSLFTMMSHTGKRNTALLIPNLRIRWR